MRMSHNPNYPVSQKRINSMNKIKNRELHVFGKKTSLKPRTRK